MYETLFFNLKYIFVDAMIFFRLIEKLIFASLILFFYFDRMAKVHNNTTSEIHIVQIT